MSKKNALLTPLELKVMNVLWKLKKAFLKDIMQNWKGNENDKPHNNTVATTIKILSEKGYIGYEVFGRAHQYYPEVSKPQYQKRLLSNVVENVFAGSVTSLVSALVDNDDLSSNDLEAIQQLINENLDD